MSGWNKGRITENSVALFLGLSDSYGHGITRGVAKFAKQCKNWRLYGYGWMFRPLDAIEHWQGKGIIARVESRADADRLAALNIPVVDVAGAYIHSGFYQVNNDDYCTGKKAGEYLLSCGFSRFAFCGVPSVGWSEKRKAGFLETIGNRSEQVPIFEESLPWWEQLENSEHLGEWVKSLHYPIGIFACNDTAGLKITEICKSLHMNIPDAIAILGVDNEDILCEMAAPSLSSIMLDCETIGYQAAALLESLLSGDRYEDTPRRVEYIPPMEIVERESTQTFTSDDKLVDQAVRFIRAHGKDGINVNDVVNVLPTSRRNLELRFRNKLGRTIHEEIVRIRIENGKILLRNTNKTIAGIAAECGFRSLQRFHIMFKNRENRTPGEYRKEHQRIQSV